jgi:GTP cyclohydrolase I
MAAGGTAAVFMRALTLAQNKPSPAKTLCDTSGMDRYFKALLEEIGEDPRREGLRDTPRRTARALKFLTQGYGQKLEDVVGKATFTAKNDEMVIVRDIELYSLCEHHMLPFIGRAHVAYLPNRKVIGLSKIPRIVDMYARRLQIQENLTWQIADSVLKVTGAKGVGVVIEAKHLCMMMRGVEKQNSSMTTSAMLGRFREDSRTRTEFLTLIRG